MKDLTAEEKKQIETVLVAVQTQLNELSRKFGIQASVSCYVDDPRDTYASIYLHDERPHMLQDVSDMTDIEGCLDREWVDISKLSRKENKDGEN